METEHQVSHTRVDDDLHVATCTCGWQAYLSLDEWLTWEAVEHEANRQVKAHVTGQPLEPATLEDLLEPVAHWARSTVSRVAAWIR